MARFQNPDTFKAFKNFKTGRLSRLSRISRPAGFQGFQKSTLSKFAAILLLVLTGCGHNAVTYGDGIMLETTINPETFAFGVSIRYGKILTACVRENVVIEMQGEGSGSGEASSGTGKASASGTVTIKTGRQVNGYTVDAIRVKAEASKSAPAK